VLAQDQEYTRVWHLYVTASAVEPELHMANAIAVLKVVCQFTEMAVHFVVFYTYICDVDTNCSLSS